MTFPYHNSPNLIAADHDGWKEECGVFGVFGCVDAANLCFYGLYALQHRGQESAGIISGEGNTFNVVKEMGLVSEIFTQPRLTHLKGRNAIGHVRYSTTGASAQSNIQPLYSNTNKGPLAIAHNGNITNYQDHYTRMKDMGALFQSTTDTEVILHLVAHSPYKKIIDAFKDVLSQLEGAFSLAILGEDYLIAARDPWGFRPLALGQLNEGFVVASETCAFDLIGAKYLRDVQPGEIVYIDQNGLQSHYIDVQVRTAQCIFEHVYFARPDSLVFGSCVHFVRKAFGRQLAREFPIPADLVIAIPDSGNSAALGYAEESGIPYDIGMTRNHYIGRTFIQPTQKIRDIGVRVKLNPIHEVLKGKRVIVVDDSLVRGTTSKQRVSAIRQAGAKEVHLLISSPPVIHPCHFGIDTPKRQKLIAAQKSLSEIRRYIGADSLGYLSQAGMLASCGFQQDQFCCACFDGKYPVKPRVRAKHITEDRIIKLHA